MPVNKHWNKCANSNMTWARNVNRLLAWYPRLSRYFEMDIHSIAYADIIEFDLRHNNYEWLIRDILRRKYVNSHNVAFFYKGVFIGGISLQHGSNITFIDWQLLETREKHLDDYYKILLG